MGKVQSSFWGVGSWDQAVVSRVGRIRVTLKGSWRAYPEMEVLLSRP